MMKTLIDDEIIITLPSSKNACLFFKSSYFWFVLVAFWKRFNLFHSITWNTRMNIHLLIFVFCLDTVILSTTFHESGINIENWILIIDWFFDLCVNYIWFTKSQRFINNCFPCMEVTIKVLFHCLIIIFYLFFIQFCNIGTFRSYMAMFFSLWEYINSIFIYSMAILSDINHFFWFPISKLPKYGRWTIFFQVIIFIETFDLGLYILLVWLLYFVIKSVTDWSVPEY